MNINRAVVYRDLDPRVTRESFREIRVLNEDSFREAISFIPETPLLFSRSFRKSGIEVAFQKCRNDPVNAPFISEEEKTGDLTFIEKRAFLERVLQARLEIDESLIKMFPRILKELPLEAQIGWVAKEGERRKDLANRMRDYLKGFTEECAKVVELSCNEMGLRRLPSEIGLFTRLEALYLYGNKLKELPEEMGKLTRLEELNLVNNRMTETRPAQIARLIRLKKLFMMGNPIR